MNPRDDQYWEEKMRIFLHDPMDKALRIPGHENRARQMAEALGISTPDKSEVSHFDMMAAGLDRASLPGYHSTDPSRNGAVDFAAHPTITHPISGGALTFQGKALSAQACTEQLAQLIREDTDNPDQRWDKRTYFNYLFFVLRKRLITTNCGNLGFLWDKIPADSRIPDHSIWNHNGMTSALQASMTQSDTHGVSMVVFSLSPVQPFIEKTRKLRDHWVGSVILSWLTFEGICAVMEHLGPDHVLYPSLQDQPLVEHYLIHEITRDFAPFFEAYNASIDKWCGMRRDESVASFPNKFVFLAPAGQESDMAELIQRRIHDKWMAIGKRVLTWLGNTTRETGNNALEKNRKESNGLESMFHRQIDNFWQFSWSSAHLVSLDHQKKINELFDERKFEAIFKTVEVFAKAYATSDYSQTQRYAYPVTHSLVQTVMAAGKSVPATTRRPEPGIKCPVCGEFEILHGISDKESGSVLPHEYKKQSEKFWKQIAKSKGMEGSIIKEDEKLCAICAIKRFAPHALKNSKKKRDGDSPHPLESILKNGEFPSTTQMATFEFREKLREEGLLEPLAGKDAFNPKGLEKQLIDDRHDQPIANDDGDEKQGLSAEVRTLLNTAKEKHGIRLSDEDSYYAILMMDGDKMGDLVNGTTIAARWKDVLHPELMKRYESGTLHAKRDIWETKIHDQVTGNYDGKAGINDQTTESDDRKADKNRQKLIDRQRILSPALHATLSESLGGFALYAVPDIIRRCNGKLVYAGGDDVAAVLPLSTALNAARQIQAAYNMGFATISFEGVTELKNTTDGLSPILLLPGRGDLGLPESDRKISISAAVLICHHKQPLRGALEEAHHLLNTMAKKRMGRNAVAVRLKKRSGQERDFAAKWQGINPFLPDGSTTIVESFLAVQQAYDKGILSGSLIYRFPELAVMIDSVLRRKNSRITPDDDAVHQLIRIFAYEILHSGSFDPKSAIDGVKGGKEQVPDKMTKQKIAETLAAHIMGITIRWESSAHNKNGKWIYDGEVPVIARYLSRGGATS